MNRRGTHRVGLVMMSLAAGLLWYGGGAAGAQEAPKEAPAPSPPGGTAATQPALELPGLLPTTQPQQPSGCEKKEEKKGDDQKKKECKSPWAKVPPVRILPPPGYFRVDPDTPGYYSLWDQLVGDYREKPPKYGYPRFPLMINSFFDADFRYLEDPKNKDFEVFDDLHRCHLGDYWLFATGGEFRWRHMHEVNSRLLGVTNDYDLLRVRAFGDLWYKDIFRIYVEFIYAESLNQNLPPVLIDVNLGDLLNAFVDLKLGEINNYPAYLRVGRQELLLGSQRLVSPLDWANTRRTFQGVRAFRQGEKFDVDLFWVQPIIPNATEFDSVDNNQNFLGLWTTYRPRAGQFIDLYYLFLDNTLPPVLKPETRPVPYNVHTLGTRFAGNADKTWLWDVELDIQLGERGRQDIFAGAAAVNGGYCFKDVPWYPTVWAGWEFASGDRGSTADGGTFSTFNQLFPFGHYYFGWLDLVGRQNIHDIHSEISFYPTNWITVWLQYQHFVLASRTDALYNAAATPLRRDPTGKAGADVGDELDIILNFHLDKHTDLCIGYSQMWSGEFIKNTGPGLNPGLFYAMYNFRW
jgi:hypothetical protein